MVADILIVDTRKLYAPHSSSEPLNLTVEGQDSVFWIRPGKRESPGTTTKLVLRKNKNPWEKLSPSNFIQAVENVNPNPPFKIVIESLDETKERDQTSFKEKSAENLADSDWAENENIKKIEFRIDDESSGIVGSVIVAILEKHEMPCTEIATGSKSIRIEDTDYDLEKVTRMETNEIDSSSTSITIDEDGCVSQSDSYSTHAKSKSSISLHGIEIATSLFPEYWRKRANGVEIKWPFPMLILIDICGMRDLDLNSARDQIIYGEKWLDFEFNIARLVCKNLKESLSDNYWKALSEILMQKSKSPEFTRALSVINN